MVFSTSFGNDRAPGSGVTAVLGPTNTGKTHLAIERMLAHSSGIIGLPLRLLAREVYNKIVDRIGAADVALITGEEKIKPKKRRATGSRPSRPCRAISTSRSSPSTRSRSPPIWSAAMSSPIASCIRRGRDETLILGAATMRRHHRAAVARRMYRDASPPVAALLRRRPQDHAPAAPHRDRRVLGR